jgi:hypothetical protein
MYKKILSLLVFCTIVTTAFCQQIPVGECGIVYVYDANGARIKRVYFCNNGVDPYPTASVANEQYVQKGKVDIQEEATDKVETKTRVTDAAEFQSVDAIYPNPTNGIFFISFRKQLDNAEILVIDIGGKTVKRSRGSGFKISFDISSLAAGTYFISVNDKGNIITKKIVKL